MQRFAHSKLALLLIGAIVFTNAQSATEPLNNIEVGRHYLGALYIFDFPELNKLLRTDAVFEDPTAVIAFPGEAWHFIGRNAILNFFQQSKSGIVNADFHVLSEFSTGEFVVCNLEYWSDVEGEVLGVPGQVVSVRMPAVTILRIRNGLVIHHTDHVDYDLMLEQLTKQSE